MNHQARMADNPDEKPKFGYVMIDFHYRIRDFLEEMKEEQDDTSMSSAKKISEAKETIDWAIQYIDGIQKEMKEIYPKEPIDEKEYYEEEMKTLKKMYEASIEETPIGFRTISKIYLREYMRLWYAKDDAEINHKKLLKSEPLANNFELFDSFFKISNVKDKEFMPQTTFLHHIHNFKALLLKQKTIFKRLFKEEKDGEAVTPSDCRRCLKCGKIIRNLPLD